MKKPILIFILIFSFPILSYCQTSDSIEERKVTKISIKCDHEAERNPLYVIKFDDKTIEHRLNGDKYEESFLYELKPDWIENAKVLKVSEALEEYGSIAKDGVILVVLKDESWEKMSLELQNRFKMTR